ASLGRELRRVVEELTDRAPELLVVAEGGRRTARELLDELYAPLRELARCALNSLAHRLVEVVLAVEELHPPGLEAGHVDEVVERRAEAQHAVVHRAQRLELGLAKRAELLVDEHAEVPHD